MPTPVKPDIAKLAVAMYSLKPGWNGYVAEPPTRAAIETAWFYTERTRLLPARFAPSAVGGVLVTFRSEDAHRRVYVEFVNDAATPENPLGVFTLFTDGYSEPWSRMGTFPDEVIRAFLDDAIWPYWENSVMPVRAKFKVDVVKSSLYGKEPLTSLELSPVYKTDDPNSENSKFWKASPCGKLELGSVRGEIFKDFVPGTEVYVDLTPIPPAAPEPKPKP